MNYFTDEQNMTAREKWEVYQDWYKFIYDGFKILFFSQALYHFLYQYCGFIAHQNRSIFWGYYFNDDVHHLRMFLNQFGGNRQSARYGTEQWTGGPAADLKEAMCREMAVLYVPLLQVLKDLEVKHEELARAWHQFAAAAGIRDTYSFPGRYLASENTRNLLAYAASIARQRATTGGPVGLQLQFPPPFLSQPVPLLQQEVAGEHLGLEV
jgi:hypothetical protein